MRTSSPEALLSVSQAANELRLPTRTLLHRITTGKVEATKIGDGQTSPYVITRAEVERLKAEYAARRSA